MLDDDDDDGDEAPVVVFGNVQPAAYLPPDQLRSETATSMLHVQFLNRTARHVDIIWIDYGGHWIRYKTVNPGDNFETFTFVTHPWFFRDSESGTRLLALDRGEVFIPKDEDVNHAINPEGRMHLIPLLVTITVPLLSLRERCLETVGRCLQNKTDSYLLDIPHELKKDIVRRMEHYENEIILPAGIEHTDY